MRLRGGAADGAATRQSLLDAAVLLFAAEGIDAVSVRAVNRAGGAAPAAVHYHFGSKSELVGAVLARHGDAVVENIASRTRELLLAERPPGAVDLVRVLSGPYIDLLRADPELGRAWLSVVAQLSLAGDSRLNGPRATANILLEQLVARVFPDVPAPERARALRLAVITLIQMLVRLADEPGGPGAKPYEDVVVAFVAGGLVAALPRDRQPSPGPARRLT